MATWTGGGDGVHWSDANNWGGTPLVNGDSLYFNLSSQLDCENDITDIQISGISADVNAYNLNINGTSKIILSGSVSGSGDGDSGRTLNVNCPVSVTSSISLSQGMNYCRVILQDVVSGSGNIDCSGSESSVGHYSTSTYSGTITLNGSGSNASAFPSASYIINNSGYISTGVDCIVVGSFLANSQASIGSYSGAKLEFRGSFTAYSDISISGIVIVSSGYGFNSLECTGYINAQYGAEFICNRTITVGTVDCSYGGVLEPSNGSAGGTLSGSTTFALAYSNTKLRLRLHGNGSSANSKLQGNNIYLGSTILEVTEYLEPTSGSVFTICEAGYISDQFDVGLDGSTFTQQGRTFRINYLGESGNGHTSVTLTDITTVTTTKTWTGLGSSNNWSDSGNWDAGVPVNGDDIIIPETTPRNTSNNDLTNLVINNITFPYISTNAPTFTLTGNNLFISGNFSNNRFATYLNINLNIEFTTNSSTISSFDSNTTFNGKLHSGENVDILMYSNIDINGECSWLGEWSLNDNYINLNSSNLTYPANPSHLTYKKFQGVVGTTYLYLSGSLGITNYIPSIGNVYTVLDFGGGIFGEFSGLPDGTIIPLSGGNLRINYTGTTVTLTDVEGGGLVVNSKMMMMF